MTNWQTTNGLPLTSGDITGFYFEVAGNVYGLGYQRTWGFNTNLQNVVRGNSISYGLGHSQLSGGGHAAVGYTFNLSQIRRGFR